MMRRVPVSGWLLSLSLWTGCPSPQSAPSEPVAASDDNADAGTSDPDPSHDGGPDDELDVPDGGVGDPSPNDPDTGPTQPDAPWPDPGTLQADARIFTADGTEFTVDEVPDALQHALDGTSRRHVIVYVHGRACGGGGEPTKSLGEAVPELEADYEAKVLMFLWPGASVGCPLGFPEAQARESGAAFVHAIHKLAAHLSTHAVDGLTLTLITHSLGNLVLEQALEQSVEQGGAWPPSLFRTAMLNSSATASAEHPAWLSQLTFASNIYVSVNDDDAILTSATAGRGARLGKDIDGVGLSANAVYVDFTAADVNHAYYLHDGQDGDGMRAFYDAVMRGHPYDFSTATGAPATERDGTFVYIFDGT